MKKKNILIIICVCIVTIAMVIIAQAKSDITLANDNDPMTTISEDYIPSETSESEEEIIILEVVRNERIEPTTLDEANIAYENAVLRQEAANSLYISLTFMGYDISHPTVILALSEIENTEADCKYYETILNQFQEAYEWEMRAAEYPVATQVWLYMKDLGWSDTVCAGIMGNLMAEVGGQTLNLQYDLYSSSGTFYGICQWHKTFYGQIHGASLKAQCEFLEATIQKELNTYGKLYQSGMNYEKFLALENPRDVALCFAKAYERCGSGSYGVRQSNAEKAYNYFVN